MKLTHQINIDEANPFSNCKLDRKKYSDVLTSIVTNFKEGFVLALNGKWGTGKTTFIKMWLQGLKNNDYRTIYFNAWENDFHSDPLVALIGELKKLVNNKNEKFYNSLLEKGASISKKILPTILSAIASKYINIDLIVELIKNTSEATTEIFDEEVKDYVSKKQSLEDFRKEMEKFVSKVDNEKSIVFVVDELDRCKPDYAVELIEKIKHFFSVEGIVFVLSIDKIQFGNAIRGYYGSDKIDADEYLKRFIDVEYTLPQPDTLRYCEYLFEYYQFREIFHSPKYKTTIVTNDGVSFIKMLSILFQATGINLRQQEKVFVHTKIVFSLLEEDDPVFPIALAVLIFLKFFENDFYEKIKNKKLSIEELGKQLAESLSDVTELEKKKHFVLAEALIIYLYNNYKSGDINQIIDNSGKHLISSKLVADSLGMYDHYLQTFYNNSSIIHLKIDILLNKIDLTNSINI